STAPVPAPRPTLRLLEPDRSRRGRQPGQHRPARRAPDALRSASPRRRGPTPLAGPAAHRGEHPPRDRHRPRLVADPQPQAAPDTHSVPRPPPRPPTPRVRAPYSPSQSLFAQRATLLPSPELQAVAG